MGECGKSKSDSFVFQVSSGLAIKSQASYYLSRVKRRLLEASVAIDEIDPRDLVFQHTVFCQTGLPYRDPGLDTRRWQRTQGAAHLEIEAGRIFSPAQKAFVDIGLPFGPKPRLILAYLNGEALRTGCPIVELEDSLSAFVQRIGLCRDGRNIRVVKDQLTRLSAARVTLGLYLSSEHAVTINTQIITAFDLWFPKDDRQRVLWPPAVRLSQEYFDSLVKHAVPLDERAVSALSHSAMGLDIYAWLAQRLHRINPGKPQFISWPALREQFGWHYRVLRKFRQVFRLTLGMVLTQYHGARIELDEKGMTLRNSHPPVKNRVTITI